MRTGKRGKLPHRLSVCVSIFDDQSLFDIAVQGGYLVPRPRLGQVPESMSPKAAENYFNELCQRSRDHGGELLALAIREFFHRDHVRYFPISSIGFYADPRVGFDPSDSVNARVDDGGENRIRGGLRPVNLLESILWIQAPYLE
ncbi:hypothetical protein [Microbispora oryzae]|uniref:hypothetical protein n=1 Tax=Microbispora oryzae TaxID=2806554 RepID=UPI001E6142A7|nr:hypothetical protein [Microbispora oryzae]